MGIDHIDAQDGARFLERDFNQCFQQMRHYDGQIIDIVKFALTAYATLAGAALAFYKYGIDKCLDYRFPAIAVLIVGLLLGFILLVLVIRNRVYFVLVTRYVNEHRGFFLRDNPLGFPNMTRMYTNAKQPPYFDRWSSQLILLYGLALLNSGLIGVILYIFVGSLKYYMFAYGVLFFIVQLVFTYAYLQFCEGKTASKAVFGKE